MASAARSTALEAVEGGTASFPMNAFFSQHPWPCLLLAGVVGMVLKWVLDLYFLRA
jgi:hypothetical protein